MMFLKRCRVLFQYIPKKKRECVQSHAMQVNAALFVDKRYFMCVQLSVYVRVCEVCVSAWITERGEGLTSGRLAVRPPW